ncbi:putative arabinosyltransferase ARAD1 [Dichanthelium oligosanthes]|uniref:Putative arabinosyltransferase ARAD1 n=1 Tax=Dichanthelium oligosanthes TaxID=888268 RepID=A0A1E5USQ0_9POAL|nr:putative arabinosyltransferase ARAD1 [Dichanthelium oligosanthes]
MVVERKMQPQLPPPEHRRALRFVVFLGISLLAFSCWALVNSRISDAMHDSSALLGDVDKTPALTGKEGTHLPAGDSITSASAAVPASGNTTAGAVKLSDPVIREPLVRGGEGERSGRCDADSAALRVYVYDLPAEFHFAMLGWDGKGKAAWPDVRDARAVPHYPGGLNLQHSVAYWLALDILSSSLPPGSDDDTARDRPCVAVRVTNASLADVFFVPFFASLSYNRHSKLRRGERVNRNRVLQAELVKYLMRKEEWRRWGGKNHLIVPHHPNSMMEARKRLSPAMFVLSDFGRYSPDVANLKKDVIAPYKHVVRSLGDDESPAFHQRPVLAYFQGAIHRKAGGKVRQKLYQLLKDERDVHFTYGSVRQNGIRRATAGMSTSKFCLNIAGDTPSSNRLFDAIVSHCVPVIISDDIELPFEDVLDYSEFCVFVRAADAARKGFLLRLLRGVSRDEWTRMWGRLKEVARHFEYQYPSRPGDAVQMIWGAVARKMHSVKLQLHKRGRFQRTGSES